MNRLPLLLLLASAVHAPGAGFTEPSLVLYGRVLQAAGGTPHILQQGQMTLVLRNTGNPANTLTLPVTLRPTGNSQPPAFSYAVSVPLKVGPAAYELDSFIEVKGAGAQVEVVSATIDGQPASLASPEDQILSVTQEQRSGERRMDLLAGGSAEDLDGDGMPAWWEEANGFNDLDPADADGDPDDDKLTNRQEFLLGTDPRQANTTPLLLTSTVALTLDGTAGLTLNVVDSDTAPAGLTFTLTALPPSVTLWKNGAPVGLNDTFTQAEVEAGLLTLRQSGPPAGGALKFTLSDAKNPAVTASAEVSIFNPGASDGIQPSLWLDARSLPLDSNSPVITWTDRSGRTGTNGLARSLSQADPARQPVFQKLGDRPAVSFDGTGRHLLASDASLPAATRAAFLYQNVSPNPAAAQTILQSNNLDIVLDRFDGPVGYPGAASFTVGGSSIRGFRTPSGQDALHAWRFTDDEGFALSQHLYDGGLSTVTGTRPTVIPALGARVRINPQQPSQRLVEAPFNGRVHELITYDRVLSERFAGQVENYLLSKWQGAVIRDGTDSLAALNLTAGAEESILIGGFGDDQLTAGPGGGILSAGAGSNVLIGGSGADVFRYGSADSGEDIIRGFDPGRDRLDLSGRFPGQSGNAADYIHFEPFVEVENGDVMLSTRVSLFLHGPAAEPDQVLTLEGLALSREDLGRLMGDGVILAGDLVPAETMAVNPLTLKVKKAPGRSLEVVLRREGNTAHAEDVPVTFTGAATNGRDFGLTGTGGTLTRPTVHFEAGAEEASFLIRPALDAAGAETDQTFALGIVPRPRNYQPAGPAAALTLLRATAIHVSSGGNIIASQDPTGGVLSIYRTGDRAGALEIPLTLSGDAVSGVDFKPLPPRVILPDGASVITVPILPLPTAGPATTHLTVSVSADTEDYITVSPWSAEFVIVAGDPLETQGFAAWRSTNAPSSGSGTPVPLATFANQDRNNDGTSNLVEYFGGVSDLHFTQSPDVDNFEIVLPRDAPDVVLGIQRSTNLQNWEPLAGLSATGIRYDSGRGYVRSFQREAPVLRPKAEFYRVTAAYRELLPGLSGARGLFTGDPLPLASAGTAGWQPNTSADGGLVVSSPTPGAAGSLAASVTGPVTLRFEWLLANPDADLLSVELDGQAVPLPAPGPAWQPAAIVIPSGSHRVTWEYVKSSDGSASPAGSAGLRRIGITTP